MEDLLPIPRRVYYLHEGKHMLEVFSLARDVLPKARPGRKIMCRLDDGVPFEVWPGRGAPCVVQSS